MKKATLFIMLITGCLAIAEENYRLILNDAYIHKSSQLLLQYLNEWADYSRPREADNMAGLERQVYTAYEAFYKYNYDSLLIKNESKAPPKRKYLLIQKSINVLIANTSKFIYFDEEKRNVFLKTTKSNRFENFKPFIKNDSLKTLYMADDYGTMLLSFFESQYDSNSRIKMWFGQTKNKQRIFDKVNFLREYLNIYPSHWGNYWIVENEPFVDFIVFDKSYTSALIKYRINWEIGECVLRKNGNVWEIKENKIVGIE